MDKTTTMQALEASIAHWEENLQAAKDKQYDKLCSGAQNCALCELFFGEDCVGCPVAEASESSECRNTPYTKAEKVMNMYQRYQRNGDGDDISDLTNAIQEEVDFLKSLREEKSDEVEVSDPPE